MQTNPSPLSLSWKNFHARLDLPSSNSVDTSNKYQILSSAVKITWHWPESSWFFDNYKSRVKLGFLIFLSGQLLQTTATNLQMADPFPAGPSVDHASASTVAILWNRLQVKGISTTLNLEDGDRQQTMPHILDHQVISKDEEILTSGEQGDRGKKLRGTREKRQSKKCYFPEFNSQK